VARFKVSAAARNDLAAIDEYGAERFGDEAAAAYSLGFKEAFLFLRQYPLAGRQRPELRAGTRCKTYRRHLIFYRFTDDTVFIQRILHHSQDIPAHLRP